MVIAKKTGGVILIAGFLLLSSAPSSFAEEPNALVYDAEAYESAFEALRANHERISSSLGISSEDTVVPRMLGGNINDATLNPNDATSNPNNATVNPNDATRNPNNAAIRPNDATLRPNDASRRPNTTTLR